MPDTLILVLSLIASLGVHLAAVFTLPPLPVGAPPAVPRARRTHFYLEEVRVPPAERQPLVPDSRKTISAAGEAATVGPAPELPEGAVAEVPAPSIDRQPLAAPRRLALVRHFPVLEVLKPRVPDVAAFLPRRVLPQLREPDIVWDREPVPPLEDLAAKSAVLSGEVAGATGVVERVVAGVKATGSEGFKVEQVLQAIAAEHGAMRGTTAAEAVERDLELTCRVFPAEDGFVYFSLVVAEKGLQRLPVLPKDVFFLLDCSESMGQRRVRMGARAVAGMLERIMREGDRVQIEAFSESVRRCFAQMREWDRVARAGAEIFLEGLKAEGRTDILGALETLLMTEPRRPAVAVILTDGRATAGTVDSVGIVNDFTVRNSGWWQVYCLAWGNKINRFLLRFLSIPNRGYAVIDESEQNFWSVVSDLAQRLARPVLRDISYQFSSVVEAEPRRMPDLFLDAPLRVFGRIPSQRRNVAVRFSGMSAEGLKEAVYALDMEKAEAGGAEIRREWARRRIYDLVSDYILNRRADALAEARRISDETGVPVPYSTSIVPLW